MSENIRDMKKIMILLMHPTTKKGVDEAEGFVQMLVEKTKEKDYQRMRSLNLYQRFEKTFGVCGKQVTLTLSPDSNENVSEEVTYLENICKECEREHPVSSQVFLTDDKKMI